MKGVELISIKSPREIEAMRRAGRITAQARALAGSMVAPGVTTHEIDTAVRRFIESHGAKPSFLGYGGFPGSACISVNDEVIHGIPSSERVLREGDIVSVDVGACIDGFHGDNAFTFPVGQIREEAQKLLDVTQKSLYLGIEAAQAGHRVGDIGAAVQALVEQNGFAVVRQYVGHGVGHNLHEDPEIPNFGRAGHGVRLVPGMTIAIEPMVNQSGEGVRVLDNNWTVVTRSGSLSAHFEHTIAITEQGPVILTTP